MFYLRPNIGTHYSAMHYRHSILALIGITFLTVLAACDGEPKTYSQCIQKGQKAGLASESVNAIEKNCKDRFTIGLDDQLNNFRFSLSIVSVSGTKNNQSISLRFINDSPNFVVRKFEIQSNNFTWTMDNTEIGIAKSAIFTINTKGTDMLFTRESVFSVGSVHGFSLR